MALPTRTTNGILANKPSRIGMLAGLCDVGPPSWTRKPIIIPKKESPTQST